MIVTVLCWLLWLMAMIDINSAATTPKPASHSSTTLPSRATALSKSAWSRTSVSLSGSGVMHLVTYLRVAALVVSTATSQLGCAHTFIRVRPSGEVGVYPQSGPPTGARRDVARGRLGGRRSGLGVLRQRRGGGSSKADCLDVYSR